MCLRKISPAWWTPMDRAIRVLTGVPGEARDRDRGGSGPRLLWCGRRRTIDTFIFCGKVIAGAGLGGLKMLEYFEYAAFLIAVLGCLAYVMNTLETEEPPGPQQ